VSVILGDILTVNFHCGQNWNYCVDVHTWAEFVETGPRLNGVTDTRPTSMLRRNTPTPLLLPPSSCSIRYYNYFY